MLSKVRFRMLTVVIQVVAIGILLGACAKGEFQTFDKPGQVLPQAQYQVLGKTRCDQIWIDKTTEAEVAGFNMKRPQGRPANYCAPVKAAAHTSAPARAKIINGPVSAPLPSHGGGIALPAPHPSAPAREDPVLEPEKAAPPVAAPPHKPSVMQKLRAELEAAKARIRKLEGR